MLIPRSDFTALSGFDEQFVATALHDVELLLGGKIGEGHDGQNGGRRFRAPP